jgi:hypothetical protein
MATSRIRSVVPSRVVTGGRLILHGEGFSPEQGPRVFIGEQEARLLFASSRRLVVAVPPNVEGRASVRIDEGPTAADVEVGSVWATGLHQVDNPVFNAAGELFVTYSGSRGQEAPVSIFRVTRDGTREPFASGIVNDRPRSPGRSAPRTTHPRRWRLECQNPCRAQQQTPPAQRHRSKPASRQYQENRYA